MMRAPLQLLLVESAKSDAHTLVGVIRSVNSYRYKVSVAGSLCEALHILSRHHFDIVLLSATLPDASDLSAFYQIHAAHPVIPIIMLSPILDKRFAMRAIRAGAQDCLVKREINGTLLRRAIRYAIARHKSDREYKTMHGRFRGLYESAKDGICFADLSGHIVDVNDAFCRMTGRQKSELIQTSICNGISPEKYHDMDHQIVRMVLATGLPAEYEKEFERKNGSLLPVLVTLFVVRNADDKAEGVALVAKDITERKKVERLKDDFITTISHELRTPLTVVQAGIENLRDSVCGDIGQQQAIIVSHIDQNIRQLSSMINDLLDLSRLESGKEILNRQSTDLAELVVGTVHNFRAYAEANHIELKCEVPNHAAILDVDGAMIRRVLQNLIANALRYARSSVLVSLGWVHESEDRGIRICVRDDGPGVPSSEVNRLFNKFEQINKPEREQGHHGTGLGLAISREIIEKHQGRIWMENVREGGAAFHIMLRASPELMQETFSPLLTKTAKA